MDKITRPGDGAAEQVSDPEAAASMMDLLAEHVPLTLLADLAAVEGPGSAEILDDEGLPQDAWWEPDAAHQDTTGPPADDQAK
ncbi:hypothetical protein [Cellulomonas hominis]